MLSHAPRMNQTAMLLIDSFEPEGFTTLSKESIFMTPQLGVLAEVHPKAAAEVFERYLLIAILALQHAEFAMQERAVGRRLERGLVPGARFCPAAGGCGCTR